MKISFITVSYKGPHLIRNLLKGVEDAEFSFPYEYFLVDNGDDETVDMVRAQFPWVKIIAGHGNVGFSAGNNLALRQAVGEYVMLTNPDLMIFKGEMEKLVAFADANPKVGIAGPKLLNPNRSLQRNFNRFPTPLIPVYRRTFLGKTPWGRRAIEWYFMYDQDMNAPIDVDGLIGAAMLIRRTAIQSIGDLDERYFMYFDDVDYCRRAWESGWRVCYAPVAEFVHYHQRESDVKWPWQVVLNRLTRAHIASAVQYFVKYRGKQLPR